MPPRSKGPRLYLKQGSDRDSVWIIRDGTTRKSTGCGPDDRDEAEKQLAEYITQKHHPEASGKRRPDQIPVADVINIYLRHKASKVARPKELAQRGLALISWWGDKTLADVHGETCDEYAASRPPVAGRRELEDLRAAINHHRRRGLCSEVVGVDLPDKPPRRERFLTRSEAARLLWAVWRYREVQKGVKTERRSRQHVARFILVGLYTGTRASAICGAAIRPTQGGGYVDLENGVFYRRARGTTGPKQKPQPPCRIADRLLAHLRRWERKKISRGFVVEWNDQPVRSVRKAFANAVADAGLGGKVTPHVLRHTAATWLMKEGTDLWNASGLLGMDPETLKKHYGHHHPDFQEDAAKRLTGQYRGRNSVNKSGFTSKNVKRMR